MGSLRIAATVLVLTLASCSRGGGVRPTGEADGGPTGGGADAGARVDANRPIVPTFDVLVYAHSATVLYSFNPDTNTVTNIGRFVLPSGGPLPSTQSMIDIAIDADGNLYGTTRDALWRIDATNAQCTRVGDGFTATDIDGALNALSFLPRGTVSQAKETLVGVSFNGTYYEMDTQTGTVRALGRYPDGLQSSGDLVAVNGLGTFASAVGNDAQGDLLVRIDWASDGSSTATVVGGTGFGAIYGLAFRGRFLYGFTSVGRLVEINPMTGQSRMIDVTTGATQFYGAGVTTIAPVLL